MQLKIGDIDAGDRSISWDLPRRFGASLIIILSLLVSTPTFAWEGVGWFDLFKFGTSIDEVQMHRKNDELLYKETVGTKTILAYAHDERLAITTFVSYAFENGRLCGGLYRYGQGPNSLSNHYTNYCYADYSLKTIFGEPDKTIIELNESNRKNVAGYEDMVANGEASFASIWRFPDGSMILHELRKGESGILHQELYLDADGADYEDTP